MANFESLHKKLKKGQIKVCLIQQGASTFFSHYKNKKAKTSLHPIHSCSKSVTSLLIGICLKENLIPSIHTPISEYFGRYLSAEKATEKANITIFHLLTMTSGIDWREFGEWQYWSPMEFSNDIIKSALERDMVQAPGSIMNYNSGSSNLLSAIIQEVSGMKTADFAHKYLLGPLGITDTLWHEKQGISLGANGLRMSPGDMMKLGRLCLQEGQWGESQILPKAWVQESVVPRFFTYPDIGYYGYGWWVSDLMIESTSVPFYFALGLFGQFIIVVPSFEIVAVFLSENYSSTMNPLLYFRDCFSALG